MPRGVARPDEDEAMGINTERDIEANLQIGPTDQAMVRIFVAAGDAEIPMDFEPEEAEGIRDVSILGVICCVLKLERRGGRFSRRRSSTSSDDRHCRRCQCALWR